MSNSNETQDNQNFNQEKVWNDIVSIIQNEAELLQALTFGQFKLGYQIIKQHIANTEQPHLSKTSLQTQFDTLHKKKSALNEQFKDDIATIHQMREDNEDHPRSLLIIDVTESNIEKLMLHANHHQPNLTTLQKGINDIQTTLPGTKPESHVDNVKKG